MDSTESVRSEIKAVLERLKAELPRMQRPSRLAHTHSVARICASLCERFSLDPLEGTLAAYSHDALRDTPLEMQYKFAMELSDYDKFSSFAHLYDRILASPAFADKVIHGLAGASYLFFEFGYSEYPALEAVAFHSTGDLAIGALAKTLYVADKLEPSRLGLSSGTAQALETESMDALLLRAVTASVGHLKGQRGAIAQSTLDLYNALQAKDGEK
ncbi:MAG: nicotinate-nucleotide adenylyltransferase [Spirochaetes bacterium]|nr:MAG: nicotinate-nucleotide adenylyltransferase [Spirochaetota bacterium]